MSARAELRFRPLGPKASRPQSNPPFMRLAHLPRAQGSSRLVRRPAPFAASTPTRNGHCVTSLTISPPLARALAKRHYDQLTAVQTAVLAPAAQGRDLLVSAQ